VGDHYLKECPTILENIRNIKNVNILQSVPKHEALNSNILNVVTGLGAKKGEDSLLYTTPQIKLGKKDKNMYPNPS
jgi:hypothetical protein